MKIKFKKLHENAVLPTYAKDGDAAMDLTAINVIWDCDNDMFHVDFGIAVEIPKNHVGLIFPRSSIYKTGTLLSNAVGVIDSGYRGELKAKFYALVGANMYKVGERCAQLIILPYPTIEPEWSDELSNTDRGTGGFGSTGS